MEDYGTIPGKGSPTADDKKLNVGSGWVVPKKMAGYAKSLLGIMGYDPNKKKNMSSSGSGENINISSGEIFLNDDQVREIEQMGIDPRSLSPGSPHNEKYIPMGANAKKGGKTKSLFPSLFNQNNNLNGHSNSYAPGGPKSILDVGNYKPTDTISEEIVYPPAGPNVTPETVTEVEPEVTPHTPPTVEVGGGTTVTTTMERINPDGSKTLIDPKGNPINTSTELPGTGDEEWNDEYADELDDYGTEDNDDGTGVKVDPVDPAGDGEASGDGTGTGAGTGAPPNRLGAPPGLNYKAPANAGGYKPGMYTDEYGNRYQVGETGQIRYKQNVSPTSAEKFEEIAEFGGNIDEHTELDKEWSEQDPEDLKQSGVTLSPYTEPKKELPELGDGPEDEYIKSLQDRLTKSKRGSDAWLAFAALNNLTKSPGKLIPPSRVTTATINKDWDKFRRQQGEANIRTGAGITNKLIQTGMGEFVAGVDANMNTKNLQTENIINEGQFKEAAFNTDYENKSLFDYEQAVRANNLNQAKFNAAFESERSAANSKLLTAKLNADQAHLGNNAYIDRLIADRENTKLDNEYSSLDKNKMSKDYDYLSRDQYGRMSPEDRDNFLKNYGPTA